MFILIWWASVGECAPLISANILPAFSIDNLQRLLDSLTFTTGIGAFIPLLATWYFLGHLILWVSRSGPSVARKDLGSVKRLVLSLRFNIPKPDTMFDPKLEPLYRAVCSKFAPDDALIEWRQFYPLAKCFISQRLVSSLVTTYQNKYTLHRSITGASAVLFWLTLASTLLIGILTPINSASMQPNWILTVFVLAGSLLLVWGFSDSYMYHWQMFGNSLVTEAYSLIRNPRSDEVKS